MNGECEMCGRYGLLVNHIYTDVVWRVCENCNAAMHDDDDYFTDAEVDPA